MDFWPNYEQMFCKLYATFCVMFCLHALPRCHPSTKPSGLFPVGEDVSDKDRRCDVAPCPWDGSCSTVAASEQEMAFMGLFLSFIVHHLFSKGWNFCYFSVVWPAFSWNVLPTQHCWNSWWTWWKVCTNMSLPLIGIRCLLLMTLLPWHKHA